MIKFKYIDNMNQSFFGEGGLISKGGLNEIFDFWRKISETNIKITN